MTSEVLLKSEKRPRGLLASPWHTALVLIVLALNALRAAIFATHARAGQGPGRPVMYLRTMLFELLVLAIVVVGVRLRGISLQAIFGQRWRSLGQAVRDLGVGVALWFVALVIVSLLSGHGGPPDQSIGFLLPHGALEMALWVLLSMTAGVCEEAVFRGYLQGQFTALTNSAPVGILVSSATFGAVHAYQGWSRAVVIALSAILFGVVAQWRGTPRPGMFAHTLQDAIAPLLLKLMRH
jgi:membrane protease YdiL (CAAX protease family)